MRALPSRNELIDGKVNTIYLSFPSLKNPEAKAHTAEAITFCDAEPFRKWAEQDWKRRDTDYEKLKQKIMNAMLDFIEERHPGFRNLVDYCELSTPLSTEHFTGFKNGAIYGIPGIRQRYEVHWIGPRTPVKNLYLTGADATSHGVVGAMMGGLVTASLILGLRGNFMKLVADAMAYSQSLDDE
jgi:all-trans-retinol 13,14-reductase